jgi:hypothetical protein
MCWLEFKWPKEQKDIYYVNLLVFNLPGSFTNHLALAYHLWLRTWRAVLHLQVGAAKSIAAYSVWTTLSRNFHYQMHCCCCVRCLRGAGSSDEHSSIHALELELGRHPLCNLEGFYLLLLLPLGVEPRIRQLLLEPGLCKNSARCWRRCSNGHSVLLL